MAADETAPPPPEPGRRKDRHPMVRLGMRIVIGIAGSAVVLAGVVMLVIPGPGLLTIALGLALLSLEFERPRLWLEKLKARGVALKDQLEARARRRGGRTDR